MKGIVSAYYDNVQDQDIKATPDAAEAINDFRKFDWRADGTDGGDGELQLLIFTATDDNFSAMQISNSVEGKWCIAVNAVNCRRFCGPLFKKKRFKLLVDLDTAVVEQWIHAFFTDSLETFTRRLAETVEVV